MNAIETRGLTKYYGRHRGVEEVTLTVPEGDIFGFLGPNGAGKSTTIRVLLGLISATAGEARLLDRPVGDPRLLREVGYLPAETRFYKGLRVREVLKLSADLRGMDCRREGERLCEALELDPTRRVDQLSLGNRKKVGIVCAMQHRPRLYILDEPTSGLDPLMQRAFFRLLKKRGEEGATVFLSSHVLSEVRRNCRDAVILREGRVVAADRVAHWDVTGREEDFEETFLRLYEGGGDK